MKHELSKKLRLNGNPLAHSIHNRTSLLQEQRNHLSASIALKNLLQAALFQYSVKCNGN